VIHIVLILAGYAALLLTAVASVFTYSGTPAKAKRTTGSSKGFPQLRTLDNLITGSMGVGLCYHARRDLRHHMGVH